MLGERTAVATVGHGARVAGPQTGARLSTHGTEKKQENQEQWD
jgi:hypothetical protein